MAPVTTYDLLADHAAVDQLLAELLDTADKIEVVVALFRAQGIPRTTHQLAELTGVDPGRVAESLAGLLRGGVVDTWRDDGAGWWLDPQSGWAEPISTMIRLYERDRVSLLRRMSRVAIARVRSRAAGVYEIRRRNRSR